MIMLVADKHDVESGVGVSFYDFRLIGSAIVCDRSNSIVGSPRYACYPSSDNNRLLGGTNIAED